MAGVLIVKASLELVSTISTELKTRFTQSQLDDIFAENKANPKTKDAKVRTEWDMYWRVYPTVDNHHHDELMGLQDDHLHTAIKTAIKLTGLKI